MRRGSVTLFVAAIVVIVGAADPTPRLGGFEMVGIGLGTFGAIVRYQLVRGAGGGVDAEGVADAMPVEYRGEGASRAASGARSGARQRPAVVRRRGSGKRRRR